jgi:palmitoyltransferase
MIHDMLSEIQSGRTDQVVPYLDAGGDPKHIDPDGLSLLQWCAYHGDATAVRTLIGAGAPATQLGENLDLNGAVFHGHVCLVRCLIELGADVNHSLADTGETPLHAALCKSGDDRFDTIVKRLIHAGANPNCTTRAGATTDAFMRDVRTRGESPLHRAAAFGSADVIRTLLAAGAQIDFRDTNGDSPLGWASWHLRPRSILRLLCFPPFHVRE